MRQKANYYLHFYIKPPPRVNFRTKTRGYSQRLSFFYEVRIRRRDQHSRRGFGYIVGTGVPDCPLSLHFFEGEVAYEVYRV